MKRLLKYFPIAILAATAFAGNASIETFAEPTTITIGDVITYRVVITHDEGIEIAWPGAGAELGQFQISDYDLGDPVETGDGRVRQEIIYYISTYDTGEWTIPPTAIAFVDTPDSVRLLKTEPITITVKSMLSDGDWARIKAFTESDTQYTGMEKQIAAGRALQMAKEKLLRDVNDVNRIPRDPKFWIGLGVVAAIFAALIAGFLYWRKRRGEGASIFSFSATPVPPHEAALMELAALIAGQYIGKGEFKKYYSILSEILREYIERRIGVRALELSTDETMRNIGESRFPLTADLIELIKVILDRADMVKFAKLIPPDSWHFETVEFARKFIEETKPEEPEPEESESNRENEIETEKSVIIET